MEHFLQPILVQADARLHRNAAGLSRDPINEDGTKNIMFLIKEW